MSTGLEELEFDDLTEFYINDGYLPEQVYKAFYNCQNKDTRTKDSFIEELQMIILESSQDPPAENFSPDFKQKKVAKDEIGKQNHRISPEKVNSSPKWKKEEVKENKTVNFLDKNDTEIFKSLIQTTLNISSVSDILIRFRAPGNLNDALERAGKRVSKPDIKTKKACILLVEALKNLMEEMIAYKHKEVDFSKVLEAFWDCQANNKATDEEHPSLGKTLRNFFERVNEGLMYGENKDSLDDIFFSMAKSTVKFKWEDLKSRRKDNEKLGPIDISLENGNVMLGLENYFSRVLQNYKYQNGKIGPASKQTWIEDPPEVLILLPRKENPNAAEGEKDEEYRDPKDIKEIYIDRFLEKNKEEVKKAKQEKEKQMEKESSLLQREREKIEAQISRIDAYGKTQRSLKDILNDTIMFLKEECEEVRFGGKKEWSSLREGKENTPNPEVLTASIKTLENFKKEVEVKREILERSMRAVPQKTKFIDPLQKFKEYGYKLFSVLIFEENNGSGRYRNIIFDTLKKRWVDINSLDEIREEELLQAIQGRDYDMKKPLIKRNGIKPQQVCCILYVKSDSKIWDSIHESSGSPAKQHTKFKSYISNQFDSQKAPSLSNSLEARKINLKEKIINEFFTSKDATLEVTQVFKKSLVVDQLPTLPCFITFLQLEEKLFPSEILNYRILEGVLTQEGYSLSKLSKEIGDSQFEQLISMIFDPKYFDKETFKLVPTQMDLLYQKEDEYHKLAKLWTYMKKVFDFAQEELWDKATLRLIFILVKLHRIRNNELVVKFKNFCVKTLPVFCFKLVGLVDEYCLRKENDQKIFEIFNALEYATTSQLILNLYIRQIYSMLNFIRNYSRKTWIERNTLFQGNFETYLETLEKEPKVYENKKFQDIINILENEFGNAITTLPSIPDFETPNSSKLIDSYDSCVEKLRKWVRLKNYIQKKNEIFHFNSIHDANSASNPFYTKSLEEVLDL